MIGDTLDGNALPDSLAHPITGMVGRAPVDRRSAVGLQVPECCRVSAIETDAQIPPELSEYRPRECFAAPRWRLLVATSNAMLQDFPITAIT
jgi:hypothetical protein